METEKNIQVDPGFELPQNSSVLDTSKLETHRIANHRHPQLQFVVSQLASLVMPIASISKITKQDFFSVDGKHHANHGDDKFTNYIEARSNIEFMELIFSDYDHFPAGFDIDNMSNLKNTEEGILYDFHVANLSEGISLYKSKLNSKNESVFTQMISCLKSKVVYFQSQIDGEPGLNFIRSLLEKAGSGDKLENDAEAIQQLLLTRCKSVLDKLE